MYTFEYDYTNDEETQTTLVVNTVHADADLTELLTAFGHFLNAAGFSYVDGLIATKGFDAMGEPLTAEVSF